MKRPPPGALLGLFLCTLTATAAGQGDAASHAWRELAIDGETAPLRYAVVLPEGHDPARSYPLVLALPPGAQDQAMVEAGLQRYWSGHTGARGFVVVSPMAPRGETFHGGAERLLPPLLVHLRQTFRIAQGGIHLCGASNGGRSAFRLATSHPFEFQTLTVLPGHPPEQSDRDRLGRLRGKRVRMFVGGDDGPWVGESQRTAAALKDLGVDVQLTVLPGEGHVPGSLDGGVLMAHVVALHEASAVPGPEGEVHAVLDDFHDAAAKGDEDRYFAILPDDSVFLGTDATERWTGAEFRTFALPYFRRPSAWTYVPQSRHVTLSPAGDLAWFDEVLGNASYGDCRGSGVLARRDGRWQVLQYNLTVPVPNDLMGGVVARIRAFADGRAPAVTTVVVVRHAEKEAEGDDPGLTEAGRARVADLTAALRDLSFDAVYVSQYRRTRETVAPLCTARSLEPRTVPAGDARGLASRVRLEHLGQRVLIAGHSNTVPAILEALGVKVPVTMTEADYDRLYVVTLTADGARLLPLHFGTR